MNSNGSHGGSFVNKLDAGLWTNSCIRSVLACVTLCLVPAGGEPNAVPQATIPVSTQHSGRVAHPSNAQIADPALEARVNRLLRQMTLEEKIGQLVQYNDTSDATPAAAAKVQQRAMAAVNPETANHVNAMQLAATGRLGSMLNTIGAERTNTYQHLAVDKNRLHIPLLFGADVIHGFRTVYPVPLGLAATFDPELVAAVSRISAKEATTAGVRWFYSPMV